MNSLPVPENEDARLKSLRNYQILDSHTEVEFDRLTELASLICEVPFSLITLIDENRQWIKSYYNLEVKETPRKDSFCQFTILEDNPLEVTDTFKDHRFAENIYVTGDPHIRFYAGYPLIDPNGYRLGSFCVLDDKPKTLTKKQLKALELLSQQAMGLILDYKRKRDLFNYEKLFKLSGDLICIAGVDGFFKRINPAFEKLLGWSPEFLLSTSFIELIHPEDVEKTYEEITNLANNKSTSNFVNRFRTKSGEYISIQWTATPESSTGNLFASGRNVTEVYKNEALLKASEDQFRSFFENSQGFMCTHDLYGKLLSVNKAGAELLGYTVEEAMQMSLYDIIPEKHHPSIRHYIDEIWRTGKSDGLMTTKHKNGGYKIWNYRNILLKNEKGVFYIVGNSIDVTESQQLEKKLQTTQELLLETGKVARVGGWELDLIKNKVFWSDMTKAIHDLEPDYEATLETGIEFYKEGESRNKIIKYIQRAIETGKNFDTELQLITAKNRTIWVRAIGFSEIENGVCKRIYGTFQDIDLKKKADLEIINSRKFLNDLLDAASEVSIIAVDTNGLITVFNKGAEKLLGYEAKELIGRETPVKIHLESEVIEYAKELREEYGEEIDGFKTFIYKAEKLGSDEREWTYITKDNKLVPVMLVVTTIRDYAHKIIGYLGVATNLAERKRAEHELNNEKIRLTAFVQHAPAAVAMLDTDLRYLVASQRWYEEYKITEKNIIGKSHYEVFPNISSEWKNDHQRVLKGEVLKNDEERWRPNGWLHDQFLKWEVRPWYQHEGKIGGIMMFTQDITESAIQKEELRNAKIVSEEASKAKSEFLANMSHEIRTPLNGVIGFTDLVLKTRMTATQKQYLTIVHQSANSLLGIINDILDFSKIEAGKLELDIAQCDIHEITGASADIISFPIQSKGLELLLNIPPTLPRFIWADEIRLKQILSNAAKFTEKGEIELKIEILHYEPSESNEITCRFMVRDTGIGIKEEKQKKIFEAFSQEDGSTTKRYGGTGLGLTISNKLLKMMDSQLELTSVQGVGSTFFFDLTMKCEKGEPIDWEHYDTLNRILIVDDNANNRLILQQMLLLMDIQSEQVVNGLEAMEILSTDHTFDAVLMDYHMPEMDGLQTISQIRDHLNLDAEQLPIILLSSSAEDAAVVKKCEKLMVNYRVMKPIKLTDLTQCLSRLTRKEPQSDSSILVDGNKSKEGSISVLVVEDNQINMFLARTIIQKLLPNAQIHEAVNGLEAVNFCETFMPDIIFMDIQMPKMNGYEATVEIRKIKEAADVTIIALTAANVRGERDKSLAAGMNGFVAKPFVEEDLWQILNELPKLKDQNELNTLTSNNMKFNDKIIDIEKLREFYMNDNEFIREFLDLAKDSLFKAQNELHEFHINSNLAGIKTTAHRLKGAASSAFLTNITKIAQELEHMEVFKSEEIKSLLIQLDEEIEELIPVIDEHL